LGSVAVGEAGRVLARAPLGRQGRHAAEVVPRIDEVLAVAGLGPRALAGVVVGAGPGSFTGGRVAAATAKGLAHALAVPLWPFSSLEAAALEPDGAAGIRWVLFDARGDRVYAACYDLREGAVATRIPPHATRLADLLT